MPILDDFVLRSVQFLKENPDLIAALKKRSAEEVEHIKSRVEEEMRTVQLSINRVSNEIDSIKKQIVQFQSKPILQEEYESDLEKKVGEKNLLTRTLESIKDKIEQLSKLSSIDSANYQEIISNFVNRVSESPLSEKRELIQVAVNKVTSHVDQKKGGEIVVDYRYDAKMTEDWESIVKKKCEPHDVVRTSDRPGSPCCPRELTLTQNKKALQS